MCSAFPQGNCRSALPPGGRFSDPSFGFGHSYRSQKRESVFLTSRDKRLAEEILNAELIRAALRRRIERRVRLRQPTVQHTAYKPHQEIKNPIC
jgi:hypothetical protein